MKTRIRFTKTGSMKFIGHLDLMRFFQKAIRRAGLDVAYSQGYSPHQLMSFASPLGVGVTSDGDYIDVSFNTMSEIPKEDFIQHLNHFMTDEIFVTDIIMLPDTIKTSMALLTKADYEIWFRDGYESPNEVQKLFTEYMEQEVIEIKKKTKRSEVVMDVRPHILAYGFTLAEFSARTQQNYPELHRDEYESDKTIYLQLTSGSALNIKPNLIIEDFLSRLSLPVNPYSYQVHRLEMYFDDKGDVSNDQQTISDPTS